MHKVFIGTRGIKAKDRKYPSDEIRNKIVCGTLGIAKYWASVYYHKTDNTIPYDDLLQIAREALISAAYYYVPNVVAKFTTYARRCIENKLKKEINYFISFYFLINLLFLLIILQLLVC